ASAAAQLQHRDRTDAGRLLLVLAELRVATRLLGVDAIPLVGRELTHEHGELFGADLDRALPGRSQVVVPLGVAGRTALRREDVHLVAAVAREIHDRRDEL